MVRCFEDDNVVHVAGKVDPVADIETIHTELALADLDTVEKRSRATRRSRRPAATRKRKRLVAVLEKVARC